MDDLMVDHRVPPRCPTQGGLSGEVRHWQKRFPHGFTAATMVKQVVLASEPARRRVRLTSSSSSGVPGETFPYPLAPQSSEVLNR
jgi:hypothetical protein